MSILFEGSTINGMEISNRFVRSASWMAMANDDGSCTPMLASLMEKLARGGVGLIISGFSYVRPDGKNVPKQLGVYSDELIRSLRQLSKAVHKQKARIVMQITHAGLYAEKALTGQVPLAPSQMENLPALEMTVEQIKDIITTFSDAAVRAQKAGFDGVQLFCAHGYLLNQFISPFFNRRTDEYGGSIENRARAVLEIVRKIRENVGDDYPLLIKLNSEDCLYGGLTVEESLKIGGMLCDAGIDAIELSGGTWVSGDFELGDRIPSRKKISSENKEAYFRKAAKMFKQQLSVPLILVGGIRSFEVAADIVDKGDADYISMSRPFVREPELVNRWKAGDLSKSSCISCNQCLGAGIAGQPIYCVADKETA